MMVGGEDDDQCLLLARTLCVLVIRDVIWDGAAWSRLPVATVYPYSVL